MFLPGWTCNVGPYRRLTSALTHLGHTVIWPDNLPTGLHAVFSRQGLGEQALSVLEYLDSLQAQLGDRKVHIIRHSNTGFVGLLTKVLEERSNVPSQIDQVLRMKAYNGNRIQVQEIRVGDH